MDCGKNINFGLGIGNKPFCDDTALNAIRLFCSNSEELRSAEGEFGTWKRGMENIGGQALIEGWRETTGSIVGIWMRSQDPQGSSCEGKLPACDYNKGDDTAANGIRFLDSNGENHKPGE